MDEIWSLRHPLESNDDGYRLQDGASALPATGRTLRFCCECGQRLQLTWLEHERRSRHICTVCGVVHYQNPKILVSCYVHFKGKVLFCRRAESPAMGLWALPGGFVEIDESLESAIAREVLEETALVLDVRRLRLFRVVSLPHISQIYAEYRYELASLGAARAGLEALELAWFSEFDLPRDELAFASAEFSLPDEFYRCMQCGSFPVTAIVAPSCRQSRAKEEVCAQ